MCCWSGFHEPLISQTLNRPSVVLQNQAANPQTDDSRIWAKQGRLTMGTFRIVQQHTMNRYTCQFNHIHYICANQKLARKNRYTCQFNHIHYICANQKLARKNRYTCQFKQAVFTTFVQIET
jgi:hypothetical protein